MLHGWALLEPLENYTVGVIFNFKTEIRISISLFFFSRGCISKADCLYLKIILKHLLVFLILRVCSGLRFVIRWS